MSLFYHAKDRRTFSSKKDFIVQQFLILRSLPPTTHTHGSKKKTRAIFENFPADRVAFNVDKGRRWQNGYLNFGPLSVEYWARWGGKKRKSNNVVISYLSTNSSCWELEHPQTSGQLFIFNPRPGDAINVNTFAHAMSVFMIENLKFGFLVWKNDSAFNSDFLRVNWLLIMFTSGN